MSKSLQDPGTEVLIEARGVGKRFCRDLKRSLFYGVRDIAADCLGRNRDGTPLRKDEFWALQDVSFTLRRGECLGLIGANGAGKTTLLRILNGLIKPDHGEVRIRGRVGALIALGAGFNPVLTGRENIYVNAAVLGLSKRETDARLDEIIAFADIGKAIDAPVQSYSSGMTVRLGFAIAAHLEPDILLIDEVLAVGDAGFRRKCYNVLSAAKSKMAVIFVSHSANQLARLCERGMVLKEGREIFSGGSTQALEIYGSSYSSSSSVLQVEAGTQVESLLVNGHEPGTVPFRGGDQLRLDARLSFPEKVRSLEVSISVHNPALDLILHANSRLESVSLMVSPGINRIEAVIPSLCLGNGPKPVTVSIRNRETDELLVWASAAWSLAVSNNQFVPAPVYAPAIFNTTTDSEA